MKPLQLLVCFCLLSSVLASAQEASDPGNWPQFRGANATGVASDNPKLPETWSETENVH